MGLKAFILQERSDKSVIKKKDFSTLAIRCDL